MKQPPRPDFSMGGSGRALSASQDRSLSHAEQLIARGRDLGTRASQIGAPLMQAGPTSGGSLAPPGVSLRDSFSSSSGQVPVPQFASPAPSSSWAGWNSTSLYSSRASVRGDDENKSMRGDDDTRSVSGSVTGSVRTNDDVPLFGVRHHSDSLVAVARRPQRSPLKCFCRLPLAA